MHLGKVISTENVVDVEDNVVVSEQVKQGVTAEVEQTVTASVRETVSAAV